MRKTYGIAIVREYDVKPFAWFYTLLDAEKGLKFLSSKTNQTLCVVNMESIQ